PRRVLRDPRADRPRAAARAPAGGASAARGRLPHLGARLPPGSPPARPLRAGLRRPGVRGTGCAAGARDPRTRAAAGGGQGGNRGRDRQPDGPVLAPDAPLQRPRAAGALRPVRLLGGRPPARGPDRGSSLRRGDGAPPRPRLRARDRLGRATPGARLTPAAPSWTREPSARRASGPSS